MKYTSAQANNLLQKLNDEYSALLDKVQRSRDFRAAMGENVEPVHFVHNYARTRACLLSVGENIYNAMVHGKILIYSGKSGSGKTYQLKALANNPNAQFWRAGQLWDIIDKYIDGLGAFGDVGLSTYILSRGITMYAFDDVDYLLKGKTQCQKEFCKMIWDMLKRGSEIAIAVIDIEDVPVIGRFLISSQAAKCAIWKFL